MLAIRPVTDCASYLLIHPLGHEPHQLVWHHPWPAVRLFHRPVLWAGDGPAGAGSAPGQRDGRTPADAQRLPQLPGHSHRGSPPHPPLLQIHRPHPHLLQVRTQQCSSTSSLNPVPGSPSNLTKLLFSPAFSFSRSCLQMTGSLPMMPEI